MSKTDIPPAERGRMGSFLWGNRSGGHYYGVGILVGLLAGLAATLFHFLSDRFGRLLFAWVESRAFPVQFPLVLVVPTVGLFLVGIALQRFPKGALGGVREVSEAIEQRDGEIPWERALNVVLSGLVLAFGGSVGPEGPMVQMGALLGSKVGKARSLPPEAMRMLVRAGAAAGIAGAFRSPAGGILLTLEIFGARFDRELPAIGAAAVVSFLTRTALLGREEPFGLPYLPQQLPLPGLLLIVPLMGIAAAPAGHLFIRLLAWLRRAFPRRWPLCARVGAGGFLVGCIGIYFPQVMSAGYEVVEHSLDGHLAFRLLVTLFFLKMLATSITFGSGAVGGLFAPTLFMGAMFGGAFGFGFRAIYPGAVPQPEVYILLGMVVMFGSIVKGYWSGLLLVADMSGCYNVILLPGIIAGGISFLISWKLHDRSVFNLPLSAGDTGIQRSGPEESDADFQGAAPTEPQPMSLGAHPALVPHHVPSAVSFQPSAAFSPESSQPRPEKDPRKSTSKKTC